MEATIKNIILEELISSESEVELESDSSSESEAEKQNVILFSLCKIKRTCIEKYLKDVVPHYSEKEFVTHFRISSELFNQLVQKLSASEEFKKLDPDRTYSAESHMALFLWFAGHEACSYRDIADRFNVALGTVCSMIKRVIYFLSNVCEATIKWPNDEKKVETARIMQEKTGMYGVIGVIDGTRIRIDPPKHGKNDYIDRKNVVSICLQGICDENKKFIDIFVGYPGSVHDNRVYENSCIYPQLPSLCNNFFLLGDSAYACSKFCITPFRDNGHLTSRQKFFNRKLSSGRIVIEHSFGILKQRFRQLYYCKLRGMEKLCHFVRACVVLHNLCSDDEFVFNDEEEPSEVHAENTDRSHEEGFTFREQLCEEVFNYFN